MAYKTKFLHFKTKASYEAERAKTTEGSEERKVFDAYISFIDEGPMICTWGKEYKCDISASEVEALVNAGKISPATVAPLIAGTAAVGTSTKYAREDHRHPAQTTVSGNAGTATKLTTPRVIAIAGAISGSATFDGSSNVSINSTLNSFDASKITSGTLNADRLPEIPISKIPAAVMKKLYVVASQSAAMSLTVQEGDVVQIGSRGPMYFCVSESASTFATKFKVFTAGAAISVPWVGVTNAPTNLSQFSNDAGYLTSIPAATSSTYGGIQIGYTTSGRNYAVQLSNGKAYVYVPWTDSLPTATSSVLGGVKIGSNITVSSGTISLSKANVTSALGYTPANTSDIPKIPIALPNPYALTINGTSYTGSSAVSVTTPKILSTTTLSSSTVSAGYSYNNTASRTISSLSGFSASNPDSVIISTAKLTFTASNAIKMDGLADLSGTYYIYCLSYMANGKIAVNGAVYA